LDLVLADSLFEKVHFVLVFDVSDPH